MKTQILDTEASLQVAKQAAHDIRAPLTALQFLMSETHGGSEHEELLKTIIGRINRIANDLLAAGKAESKTSSAVTKAELANAIDRLCQEKEIQLRRDGISLQIEWICRENFSIKTDLSELLRVISNFINNSVEAGANRICLKVSYLNGRVRFAVVDNGVGFEEKSPKKLSSHGLGLKGAANFLKLHKARLKVARVAGLTRVGFGIAVS